MIYYKPAAPKLWIETEWTLNTIMAWNIQILIGLTSVGIINLIYFYYITKPSVTEKIEDPCPTSVYFNAFTQFMENNGKLSYSDYIPTNCIGRLSKDVDSTIKNSVSKAIQQCHIQNAMKVGRMTQNDNILTLFTSWTVDSDKFHVHNNTVINWNTFMPHVNLVLFTNDSSLSNYVTDRGWTSYSILHHAAGGAPILKYMFNTVMKNFNSTFYGYANSDNLFDSSLIDTLSTINLKFDVKTPLFISGRRTNVAFLNMKEAASYGNIRHAAQTRGELFATNAEDFFITNKYFDWSRIPELVIGRRAYDNWLVLHARTVRSTTIDVSKTLLAVHQTTQGGNFEGHSHIDPHYNDNLLISLQLDRSYEKGFTTCMEYESFLSLCEETEIMKRSELPNYCI